MEKILVSRCLLGEAVRFDGQAKALRHPLLQLWQQQQRLIPFCPELAGGLPTPRPAAEIQSDGRVITCQGKDVSRAFNAGAKAALALCQKYRIRFALLKERSPSCATEWRYDGHFQGRLVRGEGVTTALLRQHGIAVFNENQLELLQQQLSQAAT